MVILTLYDIQKQPGAYRRLWIRIFKSCETWRRATGKWLQRSGNKIVTAFLQGLSSVKDFSKTWWLFTNLHNVILPKNLSTSWPFIRVLTARRSFHSCTIKVVARRTSLYHSDFFLFWKGSVKKKVYVCIYHALVPNSNPSDTNIARTT